MAVVEDLNMEELSKVALVEKATCIYAYNSSKREPSKINSFEGMSGRGIVLPVYRS